MPLSLLRFIIFAAAKLKRVPEKTFLAKHPVLIK